MREHSTGQNLDYLFLVVCQCNHPCLGTAMVSGVVGEPHHVQYSTQVNT